MENSTGTAKEENILNSINAMDVLKHVYPDSMFQIAKDIHNQVEDSEKFLKEKEDDMNPDEKMKIIEDVKHKKSIIRGTLQLYVKYFHPGNEQLKLCRKYNVILF